MRASRVTAIVPFAACATFLLLGTGCSTPGSISQQQVERAQQTWGEGVVAIGKAHTAGQDYRAVATDHVDTLYAFDKGEVLFKPTKAADQQFRLTRQSAISYFVGGDSDFSEDTGFALQPWTNVRFDNAAIYLQDNYAVAMGNYFFKTTAGDEVKVEYTFGYLLDEKGQLRINLHHSSLPFAKP